MDNFSNIENLGKDLVNFSRAGKIIHRLRNSNNPDAIFIWIPKNAGTSIYRSLKKSGCLKAKKLTRVKYRFSQKGLVTFGHMDYSLLLKEGYVSDKFNERAFKFCISRNPYDRAISLYEYLKRFFRKHKTFSQFIEFIANDNVSPIGLFNNQGFSICNPQKRWIGNIDIDFCGRFENLNEDFKLITDNLGLQSIEIKHLNKSTRTRMIEYYDQKTKKIVEEFYSEDFDYFNYKILPDDILKKDNL